MSKAIYVAVFLLGLTSLCFGQKKDVRAIRNTFDAYRSAILNDKGEEAVKYVSSRTIKYYGEVLELIKHADSAQVSDLPLLDKLMVLSIRHRTSREDILSFDGRGLLVHAIKSGMVGKNSVANTSIGEVTVDGGFAKGQFVSNGQEAPFYFHFYKEDEQWKVDLTSIFPISTVAFRKMVDESGQSDNEFISSLLEMVTGTRPGPGIWKEVE